MGFLGLSLTYSACRLFLCLSRRFLKFVSLFLYSALESQGEPGLLLGEWEPPGK